MDDRDDYGHTSILSTSSVKRVMSITDYLISAHVSAQQHYHQQAVCNQGTIEELLSSDTGIISHYTTEYKDILTVVII